MDPLRDIGSGALKSAVFGAICALVALYQGSESVATPEGVAERFLASVESSRRQSPPIGAFVSLDDTSEPILTAPAPWLMARHRSRRTSSGP